MIGTIEIVTLFSDLQRSFWKQKEPGNNLDAPVLPTDKDVDGFTLYQFHVITGDVTRAGTDADVFIIFIGSQIDSSKLPWNVCP